ncbi:MAG TPA: 2-amino-4-hydroxy-6-hydroxymethyldihydropteridine diphosphokinase [Candidatus Gracilibacteria bacterium]
MNDRIFVAVGSSVGDGEVILDSAAKWLEKNGVKIIKKSKNYKFPPFGGVAKNEFTNAVWEVVLNPSPGSNLNTDTRARTANQQEKAEALLDLLLECEKAHGRERALKWGDRTLDLDLLVYNDLACDTGKLTLPHPEMGNRDFVQIPLQEIL